jgi:hypothetical protein
MKTVIEMAQESGFTDGELAFMGDNFIRFAAIVRADERNSWPLEMEAMERQVNILTDALAEEREACARVCDDRAFRFFSESPFFVEMHGLAAAIRARSNA